jgi:translation initiation factor IF-3
LVDPDGKQLGIKPLPEALHIARQLDLDLVEVAPEAQPPVCRIMDFGKFKFDTAQRAKESRRKTSSTSIKEMKYRPKIGVGDFDTKTRQVSKFLGEGHKVKITIMFRGREMSHQELGLKILERVADKVSDLAKVEAAPKVDGRNMIMVLAPDKRAQQAAAKAKAEADTEDAEGAQGTQGTEAVTAGAGADAPVAPESNGSTATATTEPPPQPSQNGAPAPAEPTTAEPAAEPAPQAQES